MSVLAVIPARSGSQGLRDKNIKKLGDLPLMGWTIRAARESKLIDRLIVSTDSTEYAGIARSLGAEVPFLRPAELAADVPTEDVIIHAIKTYEETSLLEFDVVVTLQCTTPFIHPSEIDLCITNASRGYAQSAVTVKEVAERPEWTFTMWNTTKVLKSFMGMPLKGDWGVRQTLQTLYIPNGACYATKVLYLMKEKRIMGKHNYGVVMPRLRSIDIDTLEDFQLAEAALAAGLIKAPPKETEFEKVWASAPG